jgi:hypothetical protein
VRASARLILQNVGTSAQVPTPVELFPTAARKHLRARETKAAAPALSAQDAILFAQVFDRVPMLLVHPAGDRNEEKTERVQALWHRFADYHRSSRRCTLAVCFQFNPVFGYYDTSATPAIKKEGTLRRRCRHRPVQYLNNIIEQDHRHQTTSECEAGIPRVPGDTTNDSWI